MSDKKYLCFKQRYGFAVYSPDDGSISHTQVVSEATEATKDDWSDVIAMDLVDYQFVPAEITVSQLERELNEAKERLDWYEEKGLEADINFNGIIEHNIPGHEWPYVLAGTAHKLKANRDQWKAMAQELAHGIVAFRDFGSAKGGTHYDVMMSALSRFNELNKP